MRSLPNLLTASRLVLLAPVMLLLASEGDPKTGWLAFGLFLVAALTDVLDGWTAHRFHCESNVGAFFDPLVDKIFANVLLTFLACHHPMWVPPWVVLVLLAREFAVQGFRSMAPCKGVVLRTGTISKLKLFFQLVAVGATMVGISWVASRGPLQMLTWTSLALALITGYVSMFQLFLKNHDLWERPAADMEIR